MVSAWAQKNPLVLGQVKVDDRSNEITAIPRLLSMLEVSGRIVTIDAMGCQKEIASKITESGADYALSVKENQPQLYEDISETVADGSESISHDFSETVDKGHGRIETRKRWDISETNYLGLCKRGRSVEESFKHRNGAVGTESGWRDDRRVTFLHLISAERRSAPACRYTRTLEHRDSLHWVVDISFREDESRVRDGNVPENLAVIRHMALNLLKRDRTVKASIKGKRKRAGWENDFLLDVISQ